MFGRDLHTQKKLNIIFLKRAMYHEVNLCHLEMGYFLTIELAHSFYDDDDGGALGENYAHHL